MTPLFSTRPNIMGVFQRLRRMALLALVLCLSFGLNGCVDYEVGIHFPEQHFGEIVQQIELGEQITTLSQSEATRWLKSLEQRAKGLQGYAVWESPAALEVHIPFGNGQELVDKFNQFFNPPVPQGRRQTEPDQLDLLNLKAELSLTQSNWLFFDQNRLRLTVDLRALGVLSEQGNILLSPGSLINLQFGLQAPLQKNLTPEALPLPTSMVEVETQEILVTEEGEEQVLTETVVDTAQPDWAMVNPPMDDGMWSLQPGKINVIEQIFWVPSYLAIATVGIIAVCLGGFWLKYRRWPGVI